MFEYNGCNRTKTRKPPIIVKKQKHTLHTDLSKYLFTYDYIICTVARFLCTGFQFSQEDNVLPSALKHTPIIDHKGTHLFAFFVNGMLCKSCVDLQAPSHVEIVW